MGGEGEGKCQFTFYYNITQRYSHPSRKQMQIVIKILQMECQEKLFLQLTLKVKLEQSVL